MATILNILTDFWKKIDISKIESLYSKYIKTSPNGFLDGIPLLVTGTSYSQSNEVTRYKSYLNQNFNENMYINPYELKVTAIVYGNTAVSQLEKLVKLSKERKYTLFLYTKLNNKIFLPVVITSFSYSEDKENFTYYTVEINMQEVNLLEITTDSETGQTTTNVYDASAMTKNTELVPVNLTPTLLDKVTEVIKREVF